jgi:polysaccharide biosynthesis/export protein
MKSLPHCSLPWPTAIAATLFLALIQGWAQEGRAQTAGEEPRAAESWSSSVRRGSARELSHMSEKTETTPPNDYVGGSTSSSQDSDYVLGPQDVIAINVWREPELSRTEPVRPDGKISLPLVGDVVASGLTAKMLQVQITKVLETYVRKPEVTVILQEANSHRFNILGEVERPGSYLLTTNMTVLDAIAVAGGFRDFAKVTKIYVLRKTLNGSSERIPFNYKNALRGKTRDLDLQLFPGDTIVVP